MILYAADRTTVHARLPGEDAGTLVRWRGALDQAIGWRHRSGAGRERLDAALTEDPAQETPP